MKTSLRRPSPALVISLIALVAALGGSAYAIKKVGTKQLKNGAVSTRKIRNGAVTETKIRNGAVTEAKIATAARDTVIAYATVNSLGQVVAGESSGPIATSNIDRNGAAYCFHGLSFAFKTALVSPLHANNEAGDNVTVSAQVDRAPFATTDCDTTSGAQLEVFTSIKNLADISGFVIAFLR